MSDWVVIATGQSLTKEDVEHVRLAWERGACKVVVVSNAYQLAPWADILVSYDRKWWAYHKEAVNFAGEKICRFNYAGVHQWQPPEAPTGCNSGLMGMHVAKDRGAKRIMLLGFDMHGTHYFGKHPEGLTNTPPTRFAQHLRQFARFNGPTVINCSPGSALTRYPMMTIKEALC